MDEEILDQLDQIKVLLDQSELIKNLEKAKQEVYHDQDLLQKIDRYHQEEHNEALRQEIYQNVRYKNYKHLENELYFFILKINQILATLTEGNACHNESH